MDANILHVSRSCFTCSFRLFLPVPLSFRDGAGITALECDALNVHFYTKCIGTLIAIAQGGDNGG